MCFGMLSRKAVMGTDFLRLMVYGDRLFIGGCIMVRRLDF